MPVYRAVMEVTHHETWEVEAANEADAREKFETLSDEVIEDETGGEVVDWQPLSIKLAP